MKKTLHTSLIMIAVILVMTAILSPTTAHAASRYSVSPGTTYYADSLGGGYHEVFADNNQYVGNRDGKFIVYADGWAIIGDDGLIDSHVELENFNISLPSTDGLMVHVWSSTTGCRLGWVPADSLDLLPRPLLADQAPNPQNPQNPPNPQNPSPQNPPNPVDDPLRPKPAINAPMENLPASVESTAEIVREIIGDTNDRTQCIVLADVSGSMIDYHRDVLEYLDDTDAEKYVFAKTMERYQGDDSFDNLETTRTSITRALNDTINRYRGKEIHILLLTDLWDNYPPRRDLIQDVDFNGEITIVRYIHVDSTSYSSSDDYDPAREFYRQILSAYPNATVNVETPAD